MYKVSGPSFGFNLQALMTPSKAFAFRILLEDLLHCFPMVGTHVDCPWPCIFDLKIGFCNALRNPISLHWPLWRFPTSNYTANLILW